MLSQEQMEQMAKALQDYRIGLFDAEDVEATRETVDDFRARWGSVSETFERTGVAVHCWKSRQARKGERRFDLYVADFGDARGVIKN